MSHDLLIAFDEPEPVQRPEREVARANDLIGSTAQSQNPSVTSRQTWNLPGAKEENVLRVGSYGQSNELGGDDEDDDFGDFEDASPPSAPISQTFEESTTRTTPAEEALAPIKSKASQSVAHAAPLPKCQTTTPRSPFSYKASVRTPKPAPATKAQTKKENDVGSHPFAGRMDLLFSADNDEDYDAGADELGDLANNPEAAMAYSKRVIAEQQQQDCMRAKDKAEQSRSFVGVEAAKDAAKDNDGAVQQKGRKPRDPNVLFDADNISDDGDGEEEDEFGEFEAWSDGKATVPTSNAAHAELPTSTFDLLRLQDGTMQRQLPEPVLTQQTAPPARPGRSRGSPDPNAALSVTRRHHRQEDDFWNDVGASKIKSSEAVQSTQDREDDTWPDFETSAASTAPSPPTRQTKFTPKKPQQPDQLPPTNVPPPVLLLSIFPQLFNSADDALFSAMSKLDLKSRQMLLSHPASHQFLRGYLSHCTVLARIIAGRKLRWKRDQRLSQSMRIGPASAGGKSGGMKLAGLGKAEVAKEDREVLEAVRLYRAQIGRLRSAVTAASSAPGLPKLPVVPDIGETLPVKALKQSEGGITAREACALCGLKREERVVKVDEGVEDSFGEWWVQNMNMHLGCKTFWEDHEKKLKSR